MPDPTYTLSELAGLVDIHPRRQPRRETAIGIEHHLLRRQVLQCLLHPLDDHLGDTRLIIDMLVDQSPEGLEVLRGASTYTYDGNWKVQAENGADGQPRINWAKLCRENGLKLQGDSGHRVLRRLKPQVHDTIHHTCDL